MANSAASVSHARRLRGEIVAPGDKSISHRAALFNAIASGTAVIEGYSLGEDCRSTLRCLEGLGVRSSLAASPDGEVHVEIQGVGLRGLEEPDRILDAGNSGTTTRLLCGILAGQPIFSIIDGDQSLRGRPMRRVTAPLRAMGAQIMGRRDGELLPLAITGGGLRGQTHRPSVASAQVKSAILLAGLYASGPTTVVEPAATRDHTERMLRAQGARIESDGLTRTVWPVEQLNACNVRVPGDFSSAAYWLTLACVHPDAVVIVRNVGLNPLRTGLLDVLRAMGASIQIFGERLEGGEPVGDLRAESSTLSGVDVDGSTIPTMIDEVPLLAVAALFASGETRIRDAAELRVKESDRLKTTATELTALGANIRELDDGLVVRGGQPLRHARVSSHSDHRLAMCLAVAAIAGDGARIAGSQAADVSYPAFWAHAGELGADIRQ